MLCPLYEVCSPVQRLAVLEVYAKLLVIHAGKEVTLLYASPVALAPAQCRVVLYWIAECNLVVAHALIPCGVSCDEAALEFRAKEQGLGTMAARFPTGLAGIESKGPQSVCS